MLKSDVHSFVDLIVLKSIHSSFVLLVLKTHPAFARGEGIIPPLLLCWLLWVLWFWLCCSYTIPPPPKVELLRWCCPNNFVFCYDDATGHGCVLTMLQLRRSVIVVGSITFDLLSLQLSWVHGFLGRTWVVLERAWNFIPLLIPNYMFCARMYLRVLSIWTTDVRKSIMRVSVCFFSARVPLGWLPFRFPLCQTFFRLSRSISFFLLHRHFMIRSFLNGFFTIVLQLRCPFLFFVFFVCRHCTDFVYLYRIFSRSLLG